MASSYNFIVLKVLSSFILLSRQLIYSNPSDSSLAPSFILSFRQLNT